MRLLIHDYVGHPFQVQLSRELARRGHGVVHAFAGQLLTPRGSLERKNSDAETLELVEVPMSSHYRRDKYRFIKRRAMEVEYGKQITALITQRKPDLVISGNTPTEPQSRIANLCYEKGIFFIPWIQDVYSVAVSKLAKKKLPVIGHIVGRWYHHLETVTLKKAAAVVAITDDFMPILKTFGVPPEKVTVIPNWAPLDELPLRPRQNAWSARHILNNKLVFLYSGTLAMKHNPDLLRRLAVEFKNDSEVHIMVISEGPGADYLQQRKKAENLDNLTILPFQDFGIMPDVLAAADILIAVLEKDAGIFSVPSKVLTYHCAGKPLLASIPSGNLAGRIIIEQNSGLCVEPDDINSFIKSAHLLRQDEVRRQEHGALARAYAELNFDIEKIADRFEKCAIKAMQRN